MQASDVGNANMSSQLWTLQVWEMQRWVHICELWITLVSSHLRKIMSHLRTIVRICEGWVHRQASHLRWISSHLRRLLPRWSLAFAMKSSQLRVRICECWLRKCEACRTEKYQILQRFKMQLDAYPNLTRALGAPNQTYAQPQKHPTDLLVQSNRQNNIIHIESSIKTQDFFQFFIKHQFSILSPKYVKWRPFSTKLHKKCLNHI